MVHHPAASAHDKKFLARYAHRIIRDVGHNLAREAPQLRRARTGRPPTRRLGLVDDGVPDVEGQLPSDDSLEEDEFASPEEAALSIRDEAPGATDHDAPHPVDDA